MGNAPVDRSWMSVTVVHDGDGDLEDFSMKAILPPARAGVGCNSSAALELHVVGKRPTERGALVTVRPGDQVRAWAVPEGAVSLESSCRLRHAAGLVSRCAKWHDFDLPLRSSAGVTYSTVSLFGKAMRKVQQVFDRLAPALDDSASKRADAFLDSVLAAMRRPSTVGMPVYVGERILTVQASGVLAGSGIWDPVHGSPRRLRTVLLDETELEDWAGTPLQVAGEPDLASSKASSKVDTSLISTCGSSKGTVDITGVQARTQALAAWQGLAAEPEAWPGLAAVAAALDAVTQPAVFWPLVEAAVVEAGQHIDPEVRAENAYTVAYGYAVAATVKVVGLRLLALHDAARELELRDFVVVAQEALWSRVRTARRRVNQHCREQALREREHFENPHFTAIRSATDPMAATAARFGAFWRRMHG